jgi:hypothetical protein
VSGVRSRLEHDRRGRIAGRARRLALVLAALALILASLLAVPQVRAAIGGVLQIGGIRIFVASPTPTPVPPSATPIPLGVRLPAAKATPLPTAAGEPPPAATSTPRPTATPLASLLDLAGATTLDEAQRQAGFEIRLPTYPSGLGVPDHVFFQELGGPMIVLIWTAPGQPAQVRLNLEEFGPGTFAEKLAPTVVQETTVNGARALWTEGPHLFVFGSGDIGPRELVRGHTLIWQQGDITYRLETDQGLPEAIRIAQSLR